MIRPDRLASLFLDAVFVFIFFPFVSMWILASFTLDSYEIAKVMSLLSLALITWEAAGRASIGIFLTGQTIIPAQGNGGHVARFLVRGALKYLPFLLVWPMAGAGESGGLLFIVTISSYVVVGILTSAISIIIYGDSVFDRIAGLTVVSLSPASEHTPRGFEPIATETALRVEPVDEDPDRGT